MVQHGGKISCLVLVLWGELSWAKRLHKTAAKKTSTKKSQRIIDAEVCHYKQDTQSTTYSRLEKGNHLQKHISAFSKEIDDKWESWVRSKILL